MLSASTDNELHHNVHSDPDAVQGCGERGSCLRRRRPPARRRRSPARRRRPPTRRRRPTRRQRDRRGVLSLHFERLGLLRLSQCRYF